VLGVPSPGGGYGLNSLHKARPTAVSRFKAP